MRRCAAVLLLAAALAAAAAPRARAAVLAVDLGSEFLKLAIVKPGRIPISIVINEMSKRKTPALVAFVDGDRLVGEEAAAVEARFPDRVVGRLTDLLGRPADDPTLAAALKAAYRPYALVPAANRTSPAAAAVRFGAGDDAPQYSAEVLVASLLEYAKGLAEAAAEGSPVTDAVITVPASFLPQQRQALLDAARLAGLNVMGLIHSHAAAALQYGIERDFTNRTDRVLLYDLGAASLQAALVTYSAYQGPKGSTSQLDVVDVAWRDHLGGQHLELVLMEHFADEFNKQLGGGQDVRSAPRAMAKLRKQVARTKHILSANTEAPISVEELWQDRDFRATITRDKFEELAGDFWAKAIEPVTELLARNNLTAADLAGIQLLGGTSRVPRIKQALSEALGGRSLDMHLDADEAPVLGAALFGANLSTTFRLRQFGLADKTPFSVAIKLDVEEAPKTLVPAMRKMPTKRAVHLHNLTVDAVAFGLDFDNAPGAMPGSHHAFHLGDWRVSGIQAAAAKQNETTGKVSIHTRVDQSGLLHVDRADASWEVWEEVPPPPPANATANATDAPPEKKEKRGWFGSKKKAPAPAPAPEAPPAGPTLRKKVVRLALNVTGGFASPGMNKTELDASRRVMRRLRAADQAKRETAKARNDLESYIISTRDRVSDSEAIQGVTTEAQREAFVAQLTEAEDWLYGDGEAVEGAEYRARLRKLREVGDRFVWRAEEAERRPQVLKVAGDFVELTRKAINTWPEVKPWLEAEAVQGLLEKVDNFTAWLEATQAEQEALPPHEDPVLRTDDVSARLLRLQKDFNRLNSKKKPRAPPPAPAPEPKAEEEAKKEESKDEGDSKPEEGKAEEGKAEGDGKPEEGGKADEAEPDEAAAEEAPAEEQPEQQQQQEPAAEGGEEEELDHDELRRRL